VFEAGEQRSIAEKIYIAVHIYAATQKQSQVCPPFHKTGSDISSRQSIFHPAGGLEVCIIFSVMFI